MNPGHQARKLRFCICAEVAEHKFSCHGNGIVLHYTHFYENAVLHRKQYGGQPVAAKALALSPKPVMAAVPPLTAAAGWCVTGVGGCAVLLSPD